MFYILLRDSAFRRINTPTDVPKGMLNLQLYVIYMLRVVGLKKHIFFSFIRCLRSGNSLLNTFISRTYKHRAVFLKVWKRVTLHLSTRMSLPTAFPMGTTQSLRRNLRYRGLTWNNWMFSFACWANDKPPHSSCYWSLVWARQERRNKLSFISGEKIILCGANEMAASWKTT